MPHNPERTLIQFLLTIAFVIAVAIFNWIKRRSEEPPEAGSERQLSPPPRSTRPSAGTAPPPVAPKPPTRKRDWEEELRRLLEGETTAPAPDETHSAPAPPPLPPPPPVYSRPRPAPMQPVAVEQERGLPVELAGLTASAQSYERASQLDVKVAEHLRAIASQVEQHKVMPQGGIASMEVAETLALVRDPRSLRSVIMASVILGPPKALQA